MSCLIYHLWLTRLLHNGDIHLMAHSLEGRVPFGDTRLLALAQSLPQELGYREGVEKWHLRKASEGFLEPAVACRPKSALSKNLRAGANHPSPFRSRLAGIGRIPGAVRG